MIRIVNEYETAQVDIYGASDSETQRKIATIDPGHEATFHGYMPLTVIMTPQVVSAPEMRK